MKIGYVIQEIKDFVIATYLFIGVVLIAYFSYQQIQIKSVAEWTKPDVGVTILIKSCFWIFNTSDVDKGFWIYVIAIVIGMIIIATIVDKYSKKMYEKVLIYMLFSPLIIVAGITLLEIALFIVMWIFIIISGISGSIVHLFPDEWQRKY